MSDESLERELILLGHAVQTPPPADDLAERVLRRLVADPEPRRRDAPWLRWWRSFARSRRRVVAVIIATVIIALALTPPVRAAVIELLRLGWVVVRSAPTAPASSPLESAGPETSRAGEMSLEEARGAVPFELVVPAELGAPDRVTVSADHRVVGMEWGAGATLIHLDQLDGAMSYAFIKKWWKELEMITVLDRDAVWFDAPHKMIYVDDDGNEHNADARLSGPSLVFQRTGSRGDVTLRLEGDLTKKRAVAIAESVRP